MFAHLDHILYMSQTPERLVTFYRDIIGMTVEEIEHDLWLCQGPERCMLIGRGQSNTLGFGAYHCETRDDLSALEKRLLEQEVLLAPSPSPLFSTDAFSFSDPDGNRLVFGVARQQPPLAYVSSSLYGRLQHLVLATDNTESLVDFYSHVIGLAISDKMMDEAGIAACWMRADEDTEHHSFAVFRTSKKGIDHHSYEVSDWASIRDWADYLAGKGIKLFWGPGRHGPGNNLFIFVLDPDGNKIEFSAELESIKSGRPMGIWANEPDTLNRWGQAFIRS